jgi:16S rRNA (guanine966-N2)-methyltransferase
MRISGGAARGIPLAVPHGSTVRPATDALRQAVFSCLGARVAGARFLDLFAGSGAYGLEALSRGAVGGGFVENSAKAIVCLRRNITAVCKCLGRDECGLTVRNGDARMVPLAGAGIPDLVFVDPPYEMIAEAAHPLFVRLGGLLDPARDALVVFEMPGETELSPPGWTVVRRLERGARQPTVGIFRQA